MNAHSVNYCHQLGIRVGLVYTYFNKNTFTELSQNSHVYNNCSVIGLDLSIMNGSYIVT